MKNTYTVYIKCADSVSFRPILELSHVSKSFADGAMTMAKAFYFETREFMCKCDQTGEVVDTVATRKINRN